jgi:TRAP-type mannitol/chloroaromatic compound transport system permease large subunit
MLEMGYLSFPVLLVLIFLRAPIGLAMMLCGIGGLYLAMGGPTVFLAKLKTETYTTFSSYSLSIIPMFLLMGQFATLSGMSSGAVQGGGELARPPARAASPWQPSGLAPVSARSAARRWPPRRR